MQGCNQRGQLIFGNVLQLVDEHHQRRVGALCGLAGLLQQGRQVAFQVTVISQARFWLQVQAYFYVRVGNLQRLCKTGKGSQPPLSQVPSRFHPAQAKQRQAQLRRQQCG
ncbi:hypothetical protein D3C78_1123220 [compost metagenome]